MGSILVPAQCCHHAMLPEAQLTQTPACRTSTMSATQYLLAARQSSCSLLFMQVTTQGSYSQSAQQYFADSSCWSVTEAAQATALGLQTCLCCTRSAQRH